MDKTELIVSQIEEAKRFLKFNKISYDRMSLLLLDNVSEILMNRIIHDEYSSDEIKCRLKAVIGDFTPEQKEEAKNDKYLKPIIQYKPLSEKLKKKINGYYDEKLKFLSVDRNYINKTLASVLSYLHHYRNEAYHKEKVRKGSIRPAAYLFLKIIIDLFLKFPLNSLSYNISGEWSWFAEKYKITHSNGIDEVKKKIYHRLKKGITKNIDVARNLSDHLFNLIDECKKRLIFVKESIIKVNNLDTAIKVVQYWDYNNFMDHKLEEEAFEKYNPKFKMRHFTDWSKRIPNIMNRPTEISKFKYFLNIEKEIEPIKEIIDDISNEIDRAIQAQIDIMRGK